MSKQQTPAAVAFFQLQKIDEEKRLVYGRAVQEVPDRANEVLDYETSKPLFEEWSRTQLDASMGKSAGNVRSMHDPKSSAGIIVPQGLTFNDAEKAIDICVHVVDDQDWQKVEKGVYTGFSVGGQYAKRWQDDGLKKTRYTAWPSEISLVDRPCIPSATFFDVQKADGSVLRKSFVVDGKPMADEAELNKAFPPKKEEPDGDEAPKKGDTKTVEGQKMEFDGKDWKPCDKAADTDGDLRKTIAALPIGRLRAGLIDDGGADPDAVDLMTFDEMVDLRLEQMAKADAPADTEIDVPGTEEQVNEMLSLLKTHKLTFGDAVALVKVHVMSGAPAAVEPKSVVLVDSREKLNVMVKSLAETLKRAEADVLPLVLVKNLSTCTAFAQLLGALEGLSKSVEYEAAAEAESSPLLKSLRVWIADGAGLLSDMAAETAREMEAGTEFEDADRPAVMALAERTKGLAKACPKAAAPAPAPALEKRDDSPLMKQLSDTQAALAKVVSEVEALKKAPGGGIRLRAVAKGDDITEGDDALSKAAPVVDSHGEKQDAATLIKGLHQQGGQPLYKLG